MVATIISKQQRESEEGNRTGLETQNRGTNLMAEDAVHCEQYTLTALNCVGVEQTSGKYPGLERFASFPVAFCGIHNPRRPYSFGGVYPRGQHMYASSMRIPPFDE